MENDKSLLKWSVAAVATVVVCFLLGYFVLPKGRDDMPEKIVQEPAPSPAAQSPAPSADTTQPDRLALRDVTAKKAEEERAEADRLRSDAAATPAEPGKEDPSVDSDSMVLEPDNAAVPPPDADAGTPTNETTSPGVPPATNPPAAPTSAQEPKSPPATKPISDRASAPSTAPSKTQSPERVPERPNLPPKRSDKPKSDETRSRPDRRPKLSEPAPPKAEVRPAGTRETVPNPDRSQLLRVRVGGVAKKRAETDAVVNRLRDKGFKPMVLPSDGGYVVQIGAFRDRAGADRQRALLSKAGFDAEIR